MDTVQNLCYGIICNAITRSELEIRHYHHAVPVHNSEESATTAWWRSFQFQLNTKKLCIYSYTFIQVFTVKIWVHTIFKK